MKISIIVAMDEQRVIGNENRLPWRLPADLKHFRAVTMGKPIIMGRKTWESIARPLPGRTNIVVTRDRDYVAEGCVVVHSLEDALDAACDHAEVMVIGGGEFYRQVLPQASTLYMTRVHDTFEGDAFFPELDEGQWREVEREDFDADADNPHAYSFIRLERIGS